MTTFFFSLMRGGRVQITLYCFSVKKVYMRGSRKFCQRGSNFDNVFYFKFDEGRKGPNNTISGPSTARFAGGPMMAQH